MHLLRRPDTGVDREGKITSTEDQPEPRWERCEGVGAGDHAFVDTVGRKGFANAKGIEDGGCGHDRDRGHEGALKGLGLFWCFEAQADDCS